MPSTCLLCLGRTGDIINALPIAWEDSRISGPVDWIVSEEFAPLLEGCSYVRPVIYRGPYFDLQGAVRDFQNRYDELRIVQPWSQNWPGLRIGDSFVRTAWAQIGRSGWPGRLVFDRRDRDRESRGIELSRVGRVDPLILVASESTSSPFKDRHSLFKLLHETFFDQVVLLDTNAHRFYDLLGLFERAACLVTVDTAHLHLSWAVPELPVIALIADHPDPWHGTACRPNQLLRVRYGQYEQSKEAIVEAVRWAVERSSPVPRLIHVWSDYVRRGAVQERHQIARASWEAEYATGHWVDGSYFGHARRFAHRELPLVTDMLDNAVKSAHDEDLLVLTNDDTGFAPGLTDTLLEIAQWPLPAAYAHRAETETSGPIPLQAILDCENYPGVDLFAIGVRLWRQWRSTYPACVIGAEQWDLAMLSLMRSVGAPALPAAIWHNAHHPAWVGPDALEANTWNRRLCGNWLSDQGLTAWDVIHNVI